MKFTALYLIPLAATLIITACGASDSDDDWNLDPSGPRVEDKRSRLVSADCPPLTGREDVDRWTKLFYNEAKKAGRAVNRNVSLAITDDAIFSGQIVGLCLSWNDQNDVKIKSDWWMQSNPCMQGLLIVHELGHCAINRGHEAQGIMRPILPERCTTDQDVVDAVVDLMLPPSR